MKIEEMIRKHKIKHTPDYNKIWNEICEYRKVSKRGYSFPKKMVLVPLLMLAMVLAIGSHPIVAQKLQELPYIGSVFNYLGDAGIKKALDQHLVLEENDDLKIIDLVEQPEIISALMDSSKLYVTFILSQEDYEELNSEDLNLIFNNEEIQLLEFSYDISYEGSNNYIVYMTGKLPLNYTNDDESFVTIGYQEGDNITEKHIVRQVDSNIYKIAFKEEIDSLGLVHFHYVNVSPLAVELRFRINSKEEINENSLSFEVFDSEGNSLDPLFDFLNSNVHQARGATETWYQYSYIYGIHRLNIQIT